jgi:hypothetical protein
MTPRDDQEKHLRQALSDLVFGLALFIIFILLGFFSASRAGPAVVSHGPMSAYANLSDAAPSSRFHYSAFDATNKRFVGASSADWTRGFSNAPLPGSRPQADAAPGICPAGPEALANRTPGDWCSVRQAVLLKSRDDKLRADRSSLRSDRDSGLGAFDRHSYVEALISSGRRLNDADRSAGQATPRRIEASRTHLFMAIACVFALAGLMCGLFWAHIGRGYSAQA